MRFRLRTLLIACAIVPPAAGLFWWYTGQTGNPIVGVPLAFTFAALTAIVVVWLTELADFIGLLIIGKRRIEIRRAIPRYHLNTLVAAMFFGPAALAGVWWLATDTAFSDRFVIFGARVWGWVLLSIPVVILAYIAACFASAVTRR